MATHAPNPSDAAPEAPPMFGWRRLRAAALVTLAVYLLAMAGWTGSNLVLATRLLIVAVLLLVLFGLLERWPRHLPRWMERWALQIAGIAIAVPVALAVAYMLTSQGYSLPFWKDPQRQAGFGMLLLLCLLAAPWTASAALLRQITGHARTQALAFQLERSELERSAVEGRLRLLQAQVEPHFLFNTLANVRELVESGSPRAAQVLASLVAYLRAAVPRLHQPGCSLGQELDLVRSYLEIMHMRIPDRLQFVILADERARAESCPAMAVLTLVENAVRHGIDPSEEGGRIEVRADRVNGRIRVQVLDTGQGLRGGREGLGTGLTNLRERLQLMHGGSALLRVAEVQPHGVLAEIEWPAGAPP